MEWSPTAIVRQLLEPVPSAGTCLLACEATVPAMWIDRVVSTIASDLQLVQTLRPTLPQTDHLTAALRLERRVCSRIAAPASRA